MILVDYSNIAVIAMTSELNKMPPNSELDINYSRHLIINLLRSYRTRFAGEYGEMIIACDADTYWRKDFFPYYKANRKSAKEKSKINWDCVKLGVDTVLNDLRENFPYPVVQVDKAEGDDVIAVLAEWLGENDLQTEGMWSGHPKTSLILSADGDSIQNQRFDHIRQYSPAKRAMLTPGMPISHFINEHIAEGDGTDGVPNSLSPDNSLVDKIRQASLTKDRRAEFKKYGIGACRNEQETKWFERNRTLVDLSYIPPEIKEAVIAEYLVQKEKTDFRGRRKILNFFVKNKMPNMIDCLTDF